MTDKILRFPQVLNRIGLSRSTIYKKISDRQFPQPIPLGDRAVGWLESDIEDWIAERVATSKYESGGT